MTLDSGLRTNVLSGNATIKVRRSKTCWAEAQMFVCRRARADKKHGCLYDFRAPRASTFGKNNQETEFSDKATQHEGDTETRWAAFFSKVAQLIPSCPFVCLVFRFPSLKRTVSKSFCSDYCFDILKW